MLNGKAKYSLTSCCLVDFGTRCSVPGVRALVWDSVDTLRLVGCGGGIRGWPRLVLVVFCAALAESVVRGTPVEEVDMLREVCLGLAALLEVLFGRDRASGMSSTKGFNLYASAQRFCAFGRLQRRR